MERRYRYFVTYRGTGLPLALHDELQPCQIENRLTYFRAEFDDQARLVCVQKLVYGGVEMEHRYSYYPDGKLKRAEIADAEGEIRALEFA